MAQMINSASRADNSDEISGIGGPDGASMMVGFGILRIVSSLWLLVGALIMFGAFADAAIDELRISDSVRSEREIRDGFLADVNIRGLSVMPAKTNLLQTWTWTPQLMATSAVGLLTLPASAATWRSSDPSVAMIDPSGRVLAVGPGTSILTASIKGAFAELRLSVTPPVRPPEVDPIDPFLATPAPGALFEMPVLVINYIPTIDGTNVEKAILGKSTIEEFKKKLILFSKRDRKSVV